MSGRYSEMPTEKWCPPPEEVRGQGSGNKQVANGEMDEGAQHVLSGVIKESNRQSETYYNLLLKEGMGREQARTVLPMGQYTEAYVTANLGDWLLFLKQRLNPHAQKEIRDFAEVVNAILSDLFPVTMEAFADYQLGGCRLSAQELEWVREALSQTVTVLRENPEVRKESLSAYLPTQRERQELWSKINV
jgi:thymidylate synthase (FAD)